MKFFKKAREALKRLTGSDDTTPPPPVRPDPTPIADLFKPVPKYQQEQRDFESRAKAVTVLHTGGTFNAGRNKAKRQGRADAIKMGWSPRFAKRRQRRFIMEEVLA